MALSATMQDRILAVSRITGWVLAALLVVGAPLAALELHGRLTEHAEIGRVNARSFVDKVIACRRHSPRPHPSWQECERRVQSRE